MSHYYYAYHGPENTSAFTTDMGYGLSEKQRWKYERVKPNDKVFIIQKLKEWPTFELCGLYEVTGRYHEPTSNRPLRFHLQEVTVPDKSITLDELVLSELLPHETKGNKNWSNFKRHFCAQGVSFRAPISTGVRHILSALLAPKAVVLSDIDKDFEKDVARAQQRSAEERQRRLQKAPKIPQTSIVEGSVFQRNPDVVAEVLFRAKGICGSCKNPAPFTRRKDGSPYLEVHHIQQLAHGGEDTVENAIALCPNCHRQKHFG